jgi:hypothetical protein
MKEDVMQEMTTKKRGVLGTLARGVGAGLIGTAAMTALQEVSVRVKRHAMVGMKHEDEHDDPWQQAPAPAQLLKRAVEKVTGVEPDPAAIPLYTNVVHWGYGAALGGAYALATRRRRPKPSLAGPLFGIGVWAQSYATLVPLGLYKWPWHYSAKTIAKDLSYHLVYGTGTALGYRLLMRERR